MSENVKISDLVELGTLQDADELPVVDSSANATKRVTYQTLSSAVLNDIDDLAELTSLAADDVLPVVDASANATKRITGANLLKTGIVGQVAFFAQNTPPTGWLKANGANVSRTTYADLFTAIGTTFGVGDGSTTFALPDLRGEFPRGWDDGRGVDSSRSFGSAQLDQFQSHWHKVGYNEDQENDNDWHGYPSGSTGRWATTSGGRSNAFDNTYAKSPIVNGFKNTGTPRDGDETRPRNIALLACIKF